MEFTEVLAWLTVAAVPVCVVAALLLRKKVRKAPTLGVLGERYRIQMGLTIMALVFGLIFLNNDMDVPLLDPDTTKLITRLVIGGLAWGPAVWWIRRYRSTRRRADDARRPV